MEEIIRIALTLLGIYFALGFVFSVYFFVRGAARIDPLIKDSKWWVRLLLVPGTWAVWPLLVKKVLFKTR